VRERIFHKYNWYLHVRASLRKRQHITQVWWRARSAVLVWITRQSQQIWSTSASSILSWLALSMDSVLHIITLPHLTSFQFTSLLAYSAYERSSCIFAIDFFHLSKPNLRYMPTETGNCYGYMSYRCKFYRQVLVLGEPSIFKGAKTEMLQLGLWGYFLKSQYTRCSREDQENCYIYMVWVLVLIRRS